MKISAIIPVFNMASGGKLEFCLNSLLNQTIGTASVLEIIAVDDCSLDESYDIIKRYETRYPDVVRGYKTPRNLHQGGARNIGIREARGEWISFIDADDWVAPDYYEKLLGLAESTGADCVGCDYVMVGEQRFTIEEGDVVDHNGRPEQCGCLDENIKRSLILDGGSLCVKLFKRKQILDNKLFFPEGIFYEDNAMGASYMLTCTHYEYLPEPLYFYYQHEDSTVHRVTEEKCSNRLEAERIMIKEAGRLGFLDTFREEIEFNFTAMFYVNTLFTYMPLVRPLRISWIKNLTGEMKEYFPEFQKNKYYLERITDEERKLIAMAGKSTLYFVVYYRLLWFYRNKLT